MMADNQQKMPKINYNRFLNTLSLARKPSAIRALTELLSRSPPTMISMAGGLPNTQMFPFKDIQINLKDGTSLILNERLSNLALQYGPTAGYPTLVSQLKKFQIKFHNPPTQCLHDEHQFDLIITNGSQDGLCKVMEMLLKPNDYILIEEPTYAGSIAILQPMNLCFLPIQTDKFGMVPESLRQVLSKWKPSDSLNLDCVMPKVIYLIPNGCNPTGVSLNLMRKKEIYQIAQDYDLLIIEDDPYYFLQYSEVFTPTFLSMDTDSRVIRLDSLSKVLSSGIRLGFVSGPKLLLEKIVFHMQVSVLHASNLSQVMVSELLKMWGEEGWDAHVKMVQKFYSDRKDEMIKFAKKWLTGLAEWNEPSAGMFLWIKVLGIDDTRDMIAKKALEKEVLLLPGYTCMVDSNKPSPYMRASFSLVSPEDMDKGFERLASLIKEEQALQMK